MQFQLNIKIPVPKTIQNHKKYDNVKKNVMFNQSQVEDILFDITENSESDDCLHCHENNLLQTSDLPSFNSSISQSICWDTSSKQDIVLYTYASTTKQRALITIITNIISLDQAPSESEDEMFAFMFSKVE
ncbi:Hypothetical_protein [Hexamita inflata]|uniref:Hypothetical_protein n=1 Tax=Hexamita inflata TaxID=28002 RepID=A0AA86Q2C0_9EUKA|nr:Hypothetical protein HINF_LOCUS38301 [Hexamita inflata]